MINDKYNEFIPFHLGLSMGWGQMFRRFPTLMNLSTKILWMVPSHHIRESDIYLRMDRDWWVYCFRNICCD